MIKDLIRLRESFFPFAPIRKLGFVLSLASFSVCAGLTSAVANSPCEKAASVASRQTGVPLTVLNAISLTETGRSRNGQLQTWPWSMNVQGKGHWFKTRTDAEEYARRLLVAGVSNFDSGCFQLNYRWHGQHFDGPEDLFEPESNAIYAAEFLADLYDEFGTWSKAAGAFHSRTPKYAALYRQKFDKIFAALGASAVAPQNAVRRVNSYPLLLSGERSMSAGSLVPMSGGNAMPLIEAR